MALLYVYRITIEAFDALDYDFACQRNMGAGINVPAPVIIPATRLMTDHLSMNLVKACDYLSLCRATRQ